tara:strand:- start:481 stop:1104 length:624 start_codon:yes stop_codon:yes gene_type:complete
VFLVRRSASTIVVQEQLELSGKAIGAPKFLASTSSIASRVSSFSALDKAPLEAIGEVLVSLSGKGKGTSNERERLLFGETEVTLSHTRGDETQSWTRPAPARPLLLCAVVVLGEVGSGKRTWVDFPIGKGSTHTSTGDNQWVSRNTGVALFTKVEVRAGTKKVGEPNSPLVVMKENKPIARFTFNRAGQVAEFVVGFGGRLTWRLRE